MRVIGGRWKGRRLAPIPGRGVRPTSDRVREAWMSLLGDRLDGAAVTDLFAGSGAVGLEALSRGADHVVFVERSRTAVRVVERNIRTLNADARTTVVLGDVLAHVRRMAAADVRCDVALADPPYGKGLAQRLLSLYSETPFADELWVEHDRRDPVPEPRAGTRRRYGDTVLVGVTAPEAAPLPADAPLTGGLP